MIYLQFVDFLVLSFFFVNLDELNRKAVTHRLMISLVSRLTAWMIICSGFGY